jgi:hypothetical protein
MWVSRATYERLLEKAATADMLHIRLMEMAEHLSRMEDLREKAMERADRATDELLALRGLPPVSPPPTMPTFQNDLDEDPERVAQVESRMKQGDATVFTEGR